MKGLKYCSQKYTLLFNATLPLNNSTGTQVEVRHKSLSSCVTILIGQSLPNFYIVRNAKALFHMIDNQMNAVLEIFQTNSIS